MKPTKWIVLGAFAFQLCVTHILWFNFVPLTSLLQETYGVDELTASLQVLVFPLFYVIFTLHAGVLVDRWGYKKLLRLAASIMTLFAFCRIYTESFWFLFLAQSAIAISQPYIINAISKVVADWFEPEHNAMATGLASMGMFLGMAVGAAITPMVVSEFGLSFSMGIFAVLSLVSTLIYFVAVDERGDGAGNESAGFREYIEVLQHKNIRYMALFSFMALGAFNGLTLWLEAILGQYGISVDDAGLVAGLIIIGGILGAVVIPAMSDRTMRRKPFLMVCSLIGGLLVYPLCFTANLGPLYGYAFTLGFFFLACLPVMLSFAEEQVGKGKAGAATGLLFLCGNSGGIIAIPLMSMMNGDSGTWNNAAYFTVALLLLASFSTFGLKDLKIRAGAKGKA
ncbi:MFS transporter [Ruegeria sp. 2012CJ41-6]|uniref:MFS transporter n=1 Tax=Ruegeria spongiae TaxID=2942209 RepID=A0ABT0Q495_9RHOB|nr:MFS transporter [Ruegeria spongiae]MCL6284696.1 MFS transporter [Ruegeria spongiae]